MWIERRKNRCVLFNGDVLFFFFSDLVIDNFSFGLGVVDLVVVESLGVRL